MVEGGGGGGVHCRGRVGQWDQKQSNSIQVVEWLVEGADLRCHCVLYKWHACTVHVASESIDGIQCVVMGNA